MKKLIIIMLIMCCTLLTAKKKSPTYSNVNDIKTFSFYSGKSIGNDSLIAVNTKKNQYYVNIDKLKTNMDIYIVEWIIDGSKRLIEKNKNYNTEYVLTVQAAIIIPTVEKKKFDVVNLDDSFIKAMEEKATENEKIFKETPKEDISFVNIILP